MKLSVAVKSCFLNVLVGDVRISNAPVWLKVGVPSNLYSLYHAALQLKQKNELGVYLMNLTVSDLLYQASLPLWLQYIFQVTRRIYKQKQTITVCGKYDKIYFDEN